MLPVPLTDEEVRLLRVVLQARLSALAVEIAHTDTREFRELLLHQRAMMEATLIKLSPQTENTTEQTGYRLA